MAHEPGEITIVPTAGLTNIALAVRKEPRIAERVREVVLMGGGYHEGNWSAVAEFNIIIDPEAAHIVFNESWPVTMVGLDLTHQALATPEVDARIAAVGTAPRRGSSANCWTSSVRPTGTTRASSTRRCTTRVRWRTSSTRTS